MRLKFFLLLLLVNLAFAGFAAEAEPSADWLMVMRIDTPASIWQKLSQVQELKPVVEACGEELEKLLLPEGAILAQDSNLQSVLYCALGKKAGSWGFKFYFWRDNAGKEAEFIGDYPDLFGFFVRRSHENQYPKKETQPLSLPKEAMTLDADCHIHLKFLNKSAAGELRTALENEVLYEEKLLERRCRENLRRLQRLLKKGKIRDLPGDYSPCPLKGTYSLDRSNNRFICSHQLSKPDLASLGESEIYRSALNLMQGFEMMQHFELKLAKNSHRLIIEVEAPGDLGGKFAAGTPDFPLPQWFSGIDKFGQLSSGAAMHLLISPDFKAFLAGLKQRMMPQPAQNLPELEILRMLPEGMFSLSLFGTINPRTGRLPGLILSTPLSQKEVDKLKEMAQQMGLPAKFATREMFGLDLVMAEMPTQRHRFNEDNSTDNRLFFFPEGNDRFAFCLSEAAAREKLALLTHEKRAVSIWSDIAEEVKLAFAYRADGIGTAFLQMVNQSALQLEGRQCLENRRKWLQKHPDQAEKLTPDHELAEEVVSLCPRRGVYVASKYEKLNCAVHNYRHREEMQTTFYKARIPVGRWLRAYVTRSGNRRRLIFDFTNAGEVK